MNKKSKKIGLSILFSVLFITVAAAIIVFAANFLDKDANITWKYSVISGGEITLDNGDTFPTVQIDGVSVSAQTTEVVMPTTITGDDGRVYYVTKIKDSAFKDNKKLFGELTLPAKLESIGSSAFSGTYIYGTVTIPETVKDTFDENGKITSYGIGSSAFNNCVGIKEVILPTGVTYLQSSVFADCFALSTVHTENVTVFGSSCFKNCRALLNITISDKTIAIKANAFEECRALCGVYDLSCIGTNGNLTNDDKFGEKPDLANDAFKNCIRIEGFVIPDNNGYVNFNAFNGCSSIQGYYVKNNPNYYAFENGETPDGVLYMKNTVEDETGEEVWDGTLKLYKYPATCDRKIFTISDMVTAIAPNAFKGTASLEEIKIGNGLTSIDKDAFAGSSIEFIFIPSNIKTIEFGAFKDCTKLATVIMDEGVELVAADAFFGATSLKLVIAGSTTVSPIAAQGEFAYANEYVCKEHIYGYIDMPATCEEDGYYKCIACHRYKFVKATGHNGAIIEIGEVTCAKDAYIVVECEDCDYQTFTVITEKAPGHISNGSYYTVQSGYKTPAFTYTKCIVCNETFIDEYHANFNIMGDVNCDSKIDYMDYVVLESYIADNSSVTEFSITNADVLSDGVIDANDLALLLSYIEGEIDAFSNEFSKICTNHTMMNNLTVIEASCETPGFLISYCIRCGCLTQEVNSKQLKHYFTDSFEIPSTCSTEGQKISSCSLCNKKVSEPIEKLPHTHNWYATASSRGFEYSSCSVCGEFEYRTVDYSVLDGLFSLVQMKCTCATPCDTYFNEKLKTHISSDCYSSAFAIELKKIAEKYLVAMTQADVDATAEELSVLLSNVEYKVTGVPSVFISTVPSSQSEGYIPTSVTVAGMDDDDLTWLEAFDSNATVKIRGRGSASHGKKSYNIKFSTDVNLFGMGRSKKYALIANQNDSTLIRNALMFELSELFGIDNSCKYEIVNLYVNGELKGSYVLATAVEVGEDRVNIDEEFDYLLEIEHSPLQKDLDDCVCVKSPIYKIQFLVNEPEIKDLSGESLSYMYTCVMEIDFAIQSGDWNRIQRYVDAESVATYFVLHDYLKEIDIFWDSTRFYIKSEEYVDENGNVVVSSRLHGGPGWDFDYSMFWADIQGGGQGEHDAYKNGKCEGGVAGDPATGVWASVEWALNADSNNPYRLWFCPLYVHSTDFVKLVCKTVADLNDEMTLMYESSLDSKGNVVKLNIIDTLIEDEDIADSIGVNYDSKQKGGKYYNLRDWLKRRNTWMQEFYADKLKSLKDQ